MTEQLRNLIDALKKNSQVSKFDETETKQGMILPVLQFLGWTFWDTEEVKPEYPVEGKKATEGGRVDYCLRIRGKSKVFLEAKRPGEDLEKHQEQLLDYSFREGVDLAVLSNGIFWWFYLPLKKGLWKERKFYAIDILQQDTGEICEKFTQLLSRDNVQSGEALQNAKYIYEQLDRQKKINETLPKALNKLITGGEPRLYDLLAETTESICGFRPDDEDVKGLLKKFRDRFIIEPGPGRTIPLNNIVKISSLKARTKTESGQLRLEFFKGLLERSKGKTNLFSKVSPVSYKQFISTGTGKSGVAFSYLLFKDSAGIEITMWSSDAKKNKAVFDALYKKKNDIENELGEKLDWRRMDDKVLSRIIKIFPDGGLNSPHTWPELQEKMVDFMIRIDKTFRSRIAEVNV